MGNSLAADIIIMVATAIGVVLFIKILTARRKSYKAFVATTSNEEVCEHLRPAYELLLSRGHRATRIGQKHPDLPLEIHMLPPFDPQAVYDELKLAEPVFVSERKVLYCKEDWCEIHPKG